MSGRADLPPRGALPEAVGMRCAAAARNPGRSAPPAGRETPASRGAPAQERRRGLPLERRPGADRIGRNSRPPFRKNTNSDFERRYYKKRLLMRELEQKPKSRLTVALGYFDGVHLGHRQVLGAAVRAARAQGCKAACSPLCLGERTPSRGTPSRAGRAPPPDRGAGSRLVLLPVL